MKMKCKKCGETVEGSSYDMKAHLLDECKGNSSSVDSPTEETASLIERAKHLPVAELREQLEVAMEHECEASKRRKILIGLLRAAEAYYNESPYHIDESWTQDMNGPDNND